MPLRPLWFIFFQSLELYSSGSANAFISSPSISCKDFPAIPCKSPYIPTVDCITRSICSSRLAHCFVMALRSLFKLKLFPGGLDQRSRQRFRQLDLRSALRTIYCWFCHKSLPFASIRAISDQPLFFSVPQSPLWLNLPLFQSLEPSDSLGCPSSEAGGKKSPRSNWTGWRPILLSHPQLNSLFQRGEPYPFQLARYSLFSVVPVAGFWFRCGRGSCVHAGRLRLENPAPVCESAGRADSWSGESGK